MIVASAEAYVGLSEIPNLIKSLTGELHVNRNNDGLIVHAEHKTAYSLFIYQHLDDGNEQFTVVNNEYKIEYFTWERSPYLIRHNSTLEFWADKNGYPKIEESERSRCIHFTNEIHQLLSQH